MPNTPEQLINQGIRHAVYLERYKGSVIKDLRPLLERLETSIIGRLNGDITEWNRKRLIKQLSAIQDAIKSISKDVNNVVKGSIVDIAKYEADFEAKSLNNVVVNVDFNVPTENQLLTAVYSQPMQASGPYQGQLLQTFIDGWSERTIQKVSGAINLAYAQGTTTQQLIRDLLATGGFMDSSRRDIEGIVRTGIAHTANIARQRTWEENSSVVKGVRISATLDNKTSSICRSLDGQVYPLNKGPRPPFHIRCRTTTVAALDNRYKFLDENATRSTRGPDGKVKQVDANETYYSWLKRQPANFQDSVIGPTRGKLLRNGGISSERFAELQLGKNFEPLTLDEMRKLEPIAFEKAKV